jgi:glutamate-1-semialdehyde 2,1-aminomutase
MSVDRARQHFADRNPGSRRYFDEASRHLPGGHTRTVLTHPPFPLVFVSGEGATLTDIDGHTYIDLLGDYTAGLLGHSEHRVIDAVTEALQQNVSVGGVHPAEAKLARLMCRRFGLDRVRFTNSGTEANLMAITTAIQATGRSKVLVFEGGYHGGVLYFAHGSAAWNAPYDFVFARYNDLAGTQALIEHHGDDLAAVVMEPMLGSGGCIPATPEFARGVFEAARAQGAICIADEVMTSRHGTSGMLHLLGTTADISTFGKYLGGGFSFGAFGGRADLLDLFVDRVPHAGTFNNNVASMTAGAMVLGSVFTPEVAEAHTARGDNFRAQLSMVLAWQSLPVSITGFGSMMSLHTPTPDLLEQIYLGLIERGVYIAHRGMINVGLAHTDDQLAAASDALGNTLASLVV